MEASCVCLSSSISTFAGAPLKTRRTSSLPTHNSLSHLSIALPPLSFSSTPSSSPFPFSPRTQSFLPPAKSTERDLITDTTEALRAHLQEFRSTILEASTNNEEKKAPCSDSESSSSTSSSSSESSESEEDESPEFLPQQRNKSILTHLEGCNPVSEREDGEISMGCRHFTSTERIEVCMGGKCRQKGSVAVFGEFKKQVGIGSELYVSESKCMEKCKHGPNVRVSKGEGESVASVLSGVHLEKVDAIVDGFLGRKGISGAPTYVLPRVKEGNVSF